VVNQKPILNKMYIYAGSFVKIKKIQKSGNKIILQKLDTNETVVIPYLQSELLLKRIYTVGEVAKILEKRSDTLRKYEKRGLISSPEKFGEKYGSYQNWRFYREEDVYDLVSFFHNRVPGRPAKDVDTSINIKNIKKKMESDYVR
jgi:hypothetical protein